MKRTTVIAVLLTVISAAAFANPKTLGTTTKYQIIPSSIDGKFDLTYISEAEGMVTVKFFDDAGNLLTTDRIKDSKRFKKTYDLGSLGKGNYSVEVKNEEGRDKSNIFYNPVEVGMSMMLTSIPNSDKVKLLVAGIDEPVSVKLYDDNNHLVYEEAINVDGGFTKLFDMKAFDSDAVTFRIKSGKLRKSASINLK